MQFLLGIILFMTSAQALDLEALRLKAATLFREEFGSTDGQITIDLNPAGCLRTGYQRTEKKVVFCKTKKVINGGLESVDVINHEFFHALFCGKYPDLCEAQELDHVHEALADAFAYRLNPDMYFGENFYTAHPYVRPYKTDWLPGLVQKEHERGTAIAARIIGEGKPLAEALSLFSTPIESFVKVDVSGAEYSRLNRYRLEPNKPIQIAFQFDERAGVESVIWDLPKGMTAVPQLMVDESFRGGKGLARFYSAEKKELGRWTFYFTRKNPETP
jgi:hypothetical protein